jgi:hypothetical protein
VSGLSNGYDKEVSDEVSSDVNAETHPSVIRVRLESRDKAAKSEGTGTLSKRNLFIVWHVISIQFFLSAYYSPR